VDEYVKQCAVINPHLQLHYRVTLRSRDAVETGEGENGPSLSAPPDEGWRTYFRVMNAAPEPPREIKPHPHGVELGLLIQMLRDTRARTLRAALQQDFSRVSPAVALKICEQAGIDPHSRPSRIATQESESLYRAIASTRLMRPPTDCLSPIGEEAIIAGLRKEIEADFYTAVTRAPAVYRGNPFQIEAGIAYARPGSSATLSAEEPVRLMRFANRVPLLSMAGACAITKAVTSVNWKNYGLAQPRGALPAGPVVMLVHAASVWVPFTSESKEAVAHYPEIVREMVFALQECGRRLSVHVGRRRRQDEVERKRNYMALYIPHLALGLKEVLDLSDRDENKVVGLLRRMLERTHLET
jgi:DNA topoisomerase-6 subunit B